MKGASKTSKRLFTEEEDQKLAELVSCFGTKNWKTVSLFMIDRTPRQCRERWKYYLAPEVENGPWTQDEDNKLIELVAEYGTQWALISKCFKQRTGTNVKNRFILLQRKCSKSSTKLITDNQDECYLVSNKVTDEHIQLDNMHGEAIMEDTSSPIANEVTSVIDCWDLFKSEIFDDPFAICAF